MRPPSGPSSPSRLVFSLLAAAVAASCDGGAADGPGGPADGPAAWTVGEPLVTIGVREGEDAYQLFEVRDAALLADGRIAVAHQGSRELRVYDAEGRFLGASGGGGEGPGEYRSMTAVQALGGDTVAVTDPFQRRVSLVDVSSGTYLGVASDERVADLTPRRWFRGGLVVEGVPAERRDALATLLDRLDPAGDDAPWHVRVDDDGLAWVRPAASVGGPVRVFDLDANLLATLPVPDRFRVFRVTDDRVLGVRRDELGVEFVELRGLEGREPLSGPSPSEVLARGGEATLAPLAEAPPALSDVTSLLKFMASNQEIYYSTHSTYASDVADFESDGRFEAPEGIRIQILDAGSTGWRARFFHDESGGGCYLSYGAFPEVDGVSPGAVQCWGSPGAA